MQVVDQNFLPIVRQGVRSGIKLQTLEGVDQRVCAMNIGGLLHNGAIDIGEVVKRIADSPQIFKQRKERTG